MFFVKVIKRRSVLCINYFQIIRIFKSNDSQQSGQKKKDKRKNKTLNKKLKIEYRKWFC